MLAWLMNMGFAAGGSGITPVGDFVVGLRIDGTSVHVTTADDLSQFGDGKVFVYYLP